MEKTIDSIEITITDVDYCYTIMINNRLKQIAIINNRTDTREIFRDEAYDMLKHIFKEYI